MKKFLILLLALMLPLCALAAITVPDHVTEIGAEAFAGVNTDYLVVPATVKTVGANVLGVLLVHDTAVSRRQYRL